MKTTLSLPFLELPDNYRKLTELSGQREQLLLAHRDWAGPGEGMDGFTDDINTRQWHTAVKEALGIDKPTAVTKETLADKATK